MTISKKKLKKLQEIQDKTYYDMIDILNEFHICNVERPTGFGKTKLFMRYAKEHCDKQILFVYDTNASVDRIEKNYNPTNVDFISYAALSRYETIADNVDLILNGNYHTIIFDESHLMGAGNIKAYIYDLISALIENKCNVIGGTATPIRTDMINVSEEFFLGHITYPYSLEDAFDDKLMEIPFWNIMLYNNKRIKRSMNENKNNRYIIDGLTRLEHAYAERVGAHTIYRDTVLKALGEIPSYMKFIAFYPTIRSMKDNMCLLVDDFRKAFPEKTVSICPISSDYEHAKNYEMIELNTYSENHIDLFVSVNMLNHGYHSTTLTGIIMNRSTMSNIIYTQELGRCLNVMSEKRAIVFDNVGNCDIEPAAALANIKESIKLDLHNTKNISSIFHRMKIYVNAEDVKISRWYSRIMSVSHITYQTLDRIKSLYVKRSAPLDYIMKTYKIPKWLLLEVLGLD